MSANNPYAVIGAYVPEPPDPTVVRKTFTRTVYDSQSFFVYPSGEDYTSYDPTNKGETIFVAYMLCDSNDSDVLISNSPLTTRPDFVASSTWKDLKKSPSAYITPRQSMMPKIMVPTLLMVDNGVQGPTASPPLTSNCGYYKDPISSAMKLMFNWKVNTFNGTAVTSDKYTNYIKKGGSAGSQYVSIIAKNDASSTDNVVVLELDSPLDPPTGDWDSTSMVGNGAFMLAVNTASMTAGKDSPENSQQKPWSIVFEFGDVKITMAAAGAISLEVISGDHNTTKGSLTSGAAKSGPPQQEKMGDNKAGLYVILVYPIWNGVVVSSGLMDTAKNVVEVASTYTMKLQSASAMSYPYSGDLFHPTGGFDPVNPAPVEVDVGSGGYDTSVSFGVAPNDKILLTATNCIFDLAYLPCFFSKSMWFDEWFVASDNQPDVTFAFQVWPIWTKNGTSYDLDPVPVTASGHAGSLPDTTYQYIRWKLATPNPKTFKRRAGEIFGSILEVDETRQFPIKNGNGSFNLSWTGGTPAGSSSNWTDYIQSISVTIGLDGSSGSITVDKYGVAGQAAVATQSIGALTIEAQGGYGTVGGTIFQGLALGAGDVAQSGGASWTIPLVGLEKKLDDIFLIYVPFFDGNSLADTLDFMSRYGGIIADMSNLDNPSGTYLSVSDDINSPRFDWKSGTPTRQAIDDCMEDTLSAYVVRDGAIYFYTLDPMTGLPTNLGQDWSAQYPNTKIVNIDRTPDFDNMRNEIVVTAFQQVYDGKGSAIDNPPLYPRTDVRSNATTPDVPWAKSWFRALPGSLTIGELSDITDNIATKMSRYEVTGKLSIPGNANIKPYDQWGDYVISSVTHTLDFTAKTWTTDLEFTRKSL